MRTQISPKTGKSETEVEYTTSYGGGFYVTTDLQLKGRGIRQSGDGSDHKRGKKTYHMTENALKAVQGQFECTYYSN